MHKIIFDDNSEICIESDIIEKSSTLVALFKDPFSSTYKNSILLLDIDPQVFTYILTYLKYKPMNDKEFEEFTSKFIQTMDCNTLLNIIHAANILNIQHLVKISGDRFKTIIRNNNVDNIRKIFKIKNDFTLEEEKQLNHDFNWY